MNVNHTTSPSKSQYQLIRTYLSFCVALKLQTAATQFEKLRCYFLFLLHQTHPRSNVKVFKQGVICSCPVGFDVRRCNDKKKKKRGAEAIQDWTHLPATSSDVSVQYLVVKQIKSDSIPPLSVFSFMAVPVSARSYHSLTACGVFGTQYWWIFE